MKIEKGVLGYYYKDSKTNFSVHHGLYNNNYLWCIGYWYHNESKGFWLCNKNIYL